jgi:hypothetical protein
VATDEVEGSVNLWEQLRAGGSLEQRQQACARAVDLVDRMLAAGAVHPDLNLTNFLVRQTGGDGDLWLIDCDGVRFGATGRAARRRALERLQRSARKLDPSGAVVDPTWLA